jgi:hypothetical protein
MAKVQFPELDTEHKRTKWESIIVTTPVILTVIATILAGISSSEMSSAQYFRSLAAQMQSKVSDQWGYFQAKKLRAEQCGNTVMILRGLSQFAAVDPQNLGQTIDQLEKEMFKVNVALGVPLHPSPAISVVSNELDAHWKAVAALISKVSMAKPLADGTDGLTGFARADVPEVTEQPIGDQRISDAIHAVDAHISEEDLERQAGRIPEEAMDRAMAIANENAALFDKSIEEMDSDRAAMAKSCQDLSAESTAFERTAREAPQDVVALEPENSLAAIRGLISQISTTVAIAGLDFNSNRYQREAHYNQVLAQLLELQVRRQSYLSDRHRERSRQFFYGMLAAQAGVTIATFSLALRRRNLLWSLAASAGLAAVTFAAYVYLFV